jgi:hypothetical protein
VQRQGLGGSAASVYSKMAFEMGRLPLDKGAWGDWMGKVKDESGAKALKRGVKEREKGVKSEGRNSVEDGLVHWAVLVNSDSCREGSAKTSGPRRQRDDR